MVYNISPKIAPLWWVYLKNTQIPGVNNMFKSLSAICEEGCWTCTLLECKKLKEDL